MTNILKEIYYNIEIKKPLGWIKHNLYYEGLRLFEVGFLYGLSYVDQYVAQNHNRETTTATQFILSTTAVLFKKIFPAKEELPELVEDTNKITEEYSGNEHSYKLKDGFIKTFVETTIGTITSGAYYFTKLSQAIPKGVTTATIENFAEISETTVESGQPIYDKLLEKKEK